AAAVLGEEPEERDEEREDEALNPKRPRPPRDDEERAERDPGDAAGGAAVPAGGDDGERHCRGEAERLEGDRATDAGERVRAVEDELAEPLLVDPRAAVRPHREDVVVRKAVVRDLPP